MFFERGTLFSITMVLGLSLSAPIALAAYQEVDDDGWSEFNAQMLKSAKRVHHKVNVQPATRPRATPPNHPVNNYNAPTVIRPRVKAPNHPVNHFNKRSIFRPRVKTPIQSANHYNVPPVIKPQVQAPSKPVTSKMGPIQSVSPKFVSFVTTISVGPVWESAGQTQILNLTPDITKAYEYAAENQANILAEGELFVGVQRVLSPQIQGQLGLALAGVSNAGLSGNIWDDADPEYNNYTYAYQVQHTHLALKAKLLSDTSVFALKPYVSASVGIGFNKAQNFSNVPIIFEAVKTANFASKTTTVLTYTLGLGMQRAINTHWQAGIGYEFASWGKSQLGAAPRQTVGEGLSLSQINTNGLLFNVTYLA